MTKSEIAPDHEVRFWMDGELPVVRQEPENARIYDVKERTARFGESVIDFAKTIPQNAVTNRLISQLVGAATSVTPIMLRPMTRSQRAEARELHLIFSKIRRSAQ